MTPRRLLLPLLFLASFSAIAQSSEVSGSIGVWDSDRLGKAAVLGASYNRFWTGPFSTRLGGFIARDPEVTSAVLHVSGELHFLRDARVSPWVGAGGALVYSHLAPGNEHFKGSETGFSPIFSGGVDVAVRPRLAIGAEVSFLSYNVEMLDRVIPVDPITVVVAARYRF